MGPAPEVSCVHEEKIDMEVEGTSIYLGNKDCSLGTLSGAVLSSVLEPSAGKVFIGGSAKRFWRLFMGWAEILNCKLVLIVFGEGAPRGCDFSCVSESLGRSCVLVISRCESNPPAATLLTSESLSDFLFFLSTNDVRLCAVVTRHSRNRPAWMGINY